MPGILAGARISALTFPPFIYEYSGDIITAGAAGSFFSGTPGVQVTFTAPTTGRVLIGSACFADGPITTATTVVSTWRTGTSAGLNDVQLESDFQRAARYQIFTTTPTPAGGSMGFSQATGLTPGQTYHVEWRGKQVLSAGAVLNIRGRQLVVLPMT